jgi:hypothetical protein
LTAQLYSHSAPSAHAIHVEHDRTGGRQVALPHLREAAARRDCSVRGKGMTPPRAWGQSLRRMPRLAFAGAELARILRSRESSGHDCRGAYRVTPAAAARSSRPLCYPTVSAAVASVACVDLPLPHRQDPAVPARGFSCRSERRLWRVRLLCRGEGELVGGCEVRRDCRASDSLGGPWCAAVKVAMDQAARPQPHWDRAAKGRSADLGRRGGLQRLGGWLSRR